MRPLWGAMLLAGCSGAEPEAPPDKEPTDTDTSTSTSTSPPFDPTIETVENADGTFSTLLQATHGEEFVYFSLSEGGVQVEQDGPWQLAFRREEIRLNGGVTGTAGIEAAVLETIAFEALRYPAQGGYLTDTEDIDGDDRAEGPFNGWFAYDITDHTLSPADQTYVVRGPTGAWRMRMDSYYAPEGQSGWPTFTWGPLPEPGPLSLVEEALAVDATGEGFVFVSLAEQIALAPPDPAGSDDWDLAFSGTEIASNGGITGSGGREVARVEAPLEEVTAPADSAFMSDAPDEDGDGIPEYAVSGWYTLDPYDQSVVPVPGVSFVVRRPDETQHAFGVISYEDAQGTEGFPTFQLRALP
jgi:hypothetical protein